MNKKDFVIGILGGMGTYATINLFEEYASVFKAEKEWDRPRIIIDNRCTMPSRVRAFLYNEKVDELVNQMTESLNNLSNSGCTKIMLACCTSHLFLPKVFEKEPKLKDKVLHLIDNCVLNIANDKTKEVYLLGTEGTIESKIFQKALSKYNISCSFPSQDDYKILRDVIEAVKQNKYTKDTKTKFLSLVNRADAVILGCTELPILYKKYKKGVTAKKVYDPLALGVKKLKEEYDND